MSDSIPPINVGTVNAHTAIVGNNTFNAPVTFASGLATQPTPPPNLHNLPPLTSRFVERPDELNAVHTILTANAHKGASLRAGFRGHGGQGKSTLALAYAWKCRDAAHPWHNTYPGGTYIISCSSGNEGQANTSILAEVAALAPACGAKTEQDSRQTAANVKATLERGQLSLIILDNVTSADQWQSDEFVALLPTTNCRYLITTRAAHLADIEEVPVGYLTPEQAIQLLDNYKKIGTSQAEQAAAANIAQWIGGLAVALAAVGSMLRRTPSSTYAAYWKVLQAKPVIDLPGGDPATAKEIMYQGRAATVIDDAYDALRAPGTTTDSPEQRALQYAALLPQDMIPSPWLIALLEADAERDPAQGGITMTAPEGVAHTAAQYALQRLLDDATLTTKDETGNLLTLHRLWHARVNERAEAEKLDRTERLRAILTHAFQRDKALVFGRTALGVGTISNPAVVINVDDRWELTPLARVCADLWASGLFASAARLGGWLGYVLHVLGRTSEARACLQLRPEFDAMLTQALGQEYLAYCYSNLATILHSHALQEVFEGKTHNNTDQLVAAERAIYKSLSLLANSVGKAHQSYGTSLGILAMIYKDQRKLRTALAVMQNALKITVARVGFIHSDAAILLSNLSTIQADLKDARGAKRSLEDSIHIDLELQRRAGKPPALDHPSFAPRLHNLATACHDLGDRSSAQRYFTPAYALARKWYGEDHFDTRRIRSLMREGKYDLGIDDVSTKVY